eukprot:gene25185-33708_t
MSDINSLELVKDALYVYFQPDSIDAPSSSQFAIFKHDPSLIYTAFFADFGPLDLGLTYKFCQSLNEEMLKAKKPVLYVTSDHPHKRSNSAVLLCAYMIFALNYTVERAYAPFIGIEPPFTPFRDAGFCINTFPLTVLDCARAMHRAKVQNHFNYKTFSISTFQNLAKLQNGDVSWIVPGKFIAFSGPVSKRRQIASGEFTLSPEEYVPLFKSLGVSCVVRFNSKCYDRNVFVSNGIRHVDLFYEDGGNPTDAILQSFLQLCETEKGAVAVHCKAGLGRTGTNIAAYMIKHYSYTTKESIAWCRLCRPGSIVGPQQQYLASVEDRLVAEGVAYMQRMRNEKKLLALSVGVSSYGTAAPTNKAAAYNMMTSTTQGGQQAPTALFNSSKLHAHKVLALANGANIKEDAGGSYLPVTNHHYADESMRRPSTSAGILSGSNTAKTMKKSNEPMLRPASNYSSARNDGAAAVSTSLDGHNSNYNNNGREKDPSPPMATSGLQSTFSNRVRKNVQASRYQDNFSAPIPTQENTATGRAAAAAAENEREKERNSKIGKTCNSSTLRLIVIRLSLDSRDDAKCRNKEFSGVVELATAIFGWTLSHERAKSELIAFTRRGE